MIASELLRRNISAEHFSVVVSPARGTDDTKDYMKNEYAKL